MTSINRKVAKATKWSGITTIISRLIAPLTSMVLARLLTPEAFGVVTTLTMIISFAELFTDAGFQKYLVQHEFKDEKDKDDSTNVAFWSNFVMSLIIWGVIIIFSDPLAAMVGNPGLGNVACVSIPVAAFSSIQMALYRRDLNFKTLFKVKFISLMVPLMITIPLAVWLRSYWALVFGTIAQHVVNAFILTLYSPWKPRFFYSFDILKEMLSFTIWSLAEALSIWLTMYVDVFIVGTMLNQHYLGLYKTSTTVVQQIMTLVTTATTPVLFSALSRLQDNDKEFQQFFFKFQKLVGLLVMPLGFGIFCYRDLLTSIILGNQWGEAVGFIGLWGLVSAITIVLSYYSSELYRAKGRPKLSVLAQWLHIIVLWPVILYFVRFGFETLYIARSLVRVELILANLLIMYFAIHFPIWAMIKNVLPSFIVSILMLTIALGLRMLSDNIWWTILTFFISAFCYLCLILLFPDEKKIFSQHVLSKIRKMIRKSKDIHYHV